MINIPLDRGRAQLDTAAGVLSFFNSQGERYYDFKLAAHIEYFQRSSTDDPALKLVSNAADRHFVLAAADSFTDKEIHLEIRYGMIDYWVVGRAREKNVPIRCMHYGQDGPGHERASAHSFAEFFIVAPDRYGSCIAKKAKMAVRQGVLSWHYGKDNNFPHESGRTIIPPYFVSLRSNNDWLCVGALEIPSSEWGINLLFQDGRVATDWVYAGNLAIADTFAFPRVTFLVRDDKLAAGRAYIDRLYADGLAQHNTEWRDFWAGPMFCWFSDQLYQYQLDRSTLELEGGEERMTQLYCNDAFLEKSLRFMEEKAIPYRTIIIDYGWFIACGEWRPNTARFQNFKETIARLQRQGKKVLVWYAPYFAAQQSANWKNHPETAAHKRDGTPFSRIRLIAEVNYILDFTHPATRELCRRDFEFMLGPDGLNADGLKIDCTHEMPRVEHILHDPAWGAGELFHYRAAKFMYETAKSIKPDCCVNATSGNPLFNGTYDLHRIHDVQEYNTDCYEERAWAAWFCRAGISDLDDWASYDIFYVRSNLRKICYGAPSVYAPMKRGAGRKRPGGWGLTITPADADRELLSSIYDLHMRVPVHLNQEIFIEPWRKVFWRKHTAGPLKGFYAALTLSGNQAVAVYDEQAAHVVSLADAALSVPLPPNAKKVKLSALDRQGRARAIRDCEIINGELVFAASRCAGNLKRYRIAYELDQPLA